MSVTPTVASTKNQIRSSLPHWRGALDEGHLALFRAFVEDALSRLKGPFLAHHHPKQVLQHLETSFRFALDRPSESVNVDIRTGPAKGLVVLTNMQDQPFLVDTMRLFLRSRDSESWGGFHMVFPAVRDADGRLIGVGGDEAIQESLTLLETDAGRLADDLPAASSNLKTNLIHARAMVRDFRAMTRTVDRYVEKCEIVGDRHPEHLASAAETANFLKWLLADNFVFMGVDGGESLGFQSIDGPYRGSADGDWPPPHEPGTVRVRKSQHESPVHRAWSRCWPITMADASACVKPWWPRETIVPCPWLSMRA